MAKTERSGKRDLAYSAWHREASIRRFVDDMAASTMLMTGIDQMFWIEYDHRYAEPLALVSTQSAKGTKPQHTILRNLAKRADLPCLYVEYNLAAVPNPANPLEPDIDGFTIWILYPRTIINGVPMDPKTYAEFLLWFRLYCSDRLDLQDRNQSTDMHDLKLAQKFRR